MPDIAQLKIKVVSTELEELGSLAEDIARLCHMIPEEKHMQAKEITDRLETTVNRWLENASYS